MNTTPDFYIDQAISALKSNKLVAIPTETVYGLAAPINKPLLIQKIFELKQRPLFDPLIVHISSLCQIQPLVKTWTPVMQAFAESFWPGPLTIVVEKSESVSDLISSGLPTVGIRMPNHPLAINFIDRLQMPVAAPSANLFGQTSPTHPKHVREFFEESDVFILDGGACDVGIESTIIGIEDLNITFLRPGMITAQNICEKIPQYNFAFTHYEKSKITAPGQIKHHYMPKIPIYYLKKESLNDDLQLQISQNFANTNPRIGELDLSQTPQLAARQLYAKMRELSESGNHCIVFRELPIHTSEAWAGILDRLKRASTVVV